MLNFIQSIDLSIVEWIQNNMTNTILDKIMPFITTLGDAGLIWILICLALIITKKYRKVGFLALMSLILTTILVEIVLKHLFERNRPFTELSNLKLLVAKPTSYSFPSGHSASSFAVATVIAKMIKPWKIPAYTLATLIAFSRVYLALHYPSDVICGALTGYIVSSLVVYKFANKKNKYM